DPGTWSGTTSISYAYQWRRCDFSGATALDISVWLGLRCAVFSSDIGSTLRVAVSATNSAGSGSAVSAQTAVVSAAASAPVNTGLPTVSGTATSGQTLSADPGAWSGTTPISYAYQWRRCDSSGAGCVDIAGAASQSYTAV